MKGYLSDIIETRTCLTLAFVLTFLVIRLFRPLNDLYMKKNKFLRAYSDLSKSTLRSHKKSAIFAANQITRRTSQTIPALGIQGLSRMSRKIFKLNFQSFYYQNLAFLFQTKVKLFNSKKKSSVSLSNLIVNCISNFNGDQKQSKYDIKVNNFG